LEGRNNACAALLDLASRGSDCLSMAIVNFASAKARDDVIVYHAGGLHMSVADRRADKLEAALLQIFAQCIRLRAGRWVVFEPSQLIHDWLSVNEAPDVFVEATKLSLNLQKTLRVVDSSDDFLFVANDARIVEQGCQFPLAVSGNPLRVKLPKGFSIGFPLAQNRVPAQSSLGSLQSYEFEHRAIVVYGHTPLFVVVFNVIRLSQIDPKAAAFGEIGFT
jgi:hypothetical protein